MIGSGWTSNTSGSDRCSWISRFCSRHSASSSGRWGPPNGSEAMAKGERMSDDSQREQEFDLRVYVQILRNRKWLILGFAAALTLAVAVGTSLQSKVYEAKVTLLANREAPRLLVSDPIPGDRVGQRDYLKTQSAILASRTLLQAAVKRLIPEGFYGQVAP